MMRSLTTGLARKWFSGSKKPSRTPTFRPRIESLEDRRVPATLFVNTHLDLASSGPGVLSLREAVAIANQAPQDTIVLSQGTYTLGLGGLAITNSMTIEGQGAGLTTVDGATLYRIFQVTGQPRGILHDAVSSILPPPGPINNMVSVTFADMSLRHGNGSAAVVSGEVGGGAIQGSFANLSIVNCQVSDNTGPSGGAINDSNGNVTLTGSTVSRNVSQDNGGGIAMFGGTLVLNNSVVRANSTPGDGGGIDALTVTLTNSTVSGNVASSGGGIAASTVTLNGCTVNDNLAFQDGGAVSGNLVTLTRSTVSGNVAGQSGAGIFAGTATLTACTLSDNSAGLDGGGCSADTVSFAGTTVSSNHAARDGGGIAANVATLTGCTIDHNTAGLSGGGIVLYALGNFVGPATLTTCTLSDNSAQYGGGLWGALGGFGQMELTTANFYACTISGNHASQDGGGIDCYVALLTDSTVSGNSAGQRGGGIFNVTGDLLFDTIAENTAGNGGGIYDIGGTGVQDTIIALNLVSVGGKGPDVFHDFLDLGNNLIGAYDPTVAFTFFPGSDQLGTLAHPLLPGLTALGNHGGPTETYALLPGSKAAGAGVNVSMATLNTPVTAQATTLTVSSARDVPGIVPGELLRLDSEVVLVTAVNGNTLTVRRGVAGTRASAHGFGASLFLAADQRGVLRPAGGRVDIGAFA
jgi:hypothetical protein